MKERPILFNAEMVQAILSGRKTQTRRVMKRQPVPSTTREGDFWFSCDKMQSMVHVSDFVPGNSVIPDGHEIFSACCPIGAVGDQLWVRETFATLGNEDGCAIDWHENLVKTGGPDAAQIYRASCEQRPGNYGLWSIPDDAFWKPHTDSMQYEGSWVPSIHMPRWASRINLLITGIRVERLNSISEDDAIAEGFQPTKQWTGMDGMIGNPGMPATLKFEGVWLEIYGEESWTSNPWVWVIEFQPLKPGNE